MLTKKCGYEDGCDVNRPVDKPPEHSRAGNADEDSPYLILETPLWLDLCPWRRGNSPHSTPVIEVATKQVSTYESDADCEITQADGGCCPTVSVFKCIWQCHTYCKIG